MPPMFTSGFFNRNHLEHSPWCFIPCGPWLVVVGLPWPWQKAFARAPVRVPPSRDGFRLACGRGVCLDPSPGVGPMTGQMRSGYRCCSFLFWLLRTIRVVVRTVFASVVQHDRSRCFPRVLSTVWMVRTVLPTPILVCIWSGWCVSWRVPRAQMRCRCRLCAGTSLPGGRALTATRSTPMPSQHSLRTLRPSAWKFKTGNPSFSTCDSNFPAASWMNFGWFFGIGMSRSLRFFGSWPQRLPLPRGFSQGVGAGEGGCKGWNKAHSWGAEGRLRRFLTPTRR